MVPQPKGTYFDSAFIEYSDHCTSIMISLGLWKPLCLGKICLRTGLLCTSKSLQKVGESQEVLHYLHSDCQKWILISHHVALSLKID